MPHSMVVHTLKYNLKSYQNPTNSNIYTCVFVLCEKPFYLALSHGRKVMLIIIYESQDKLVANVC